MKASDFLWLGPGVLWVTIDGLFVIAPELARLPKSCLDPGRLQYLVDHGLARLDDAGCPYGPQREHLLDCFRGSTMFNPNRLSVQKALWNLYHELRGGLAYQPPPVRPGDNPFNGNRYEVVTEAVGNRGAAPISSTLVFPAPVPLTPEQERAQLQELVQASADEHRADREAADRVKTAMKDAGYQLTV